MCAPVVDFVVLMDHLADAALTKNILNSPCTIPCTLYCGTKVHELDDQLMLLVREGSSTCLSTLHAVQILASLYSSSGIDASKSLYGFHLNCSKSLLLENLC